MNKKIDDERNLLITNSISIDAFCPLMRTHWGVVSHPLMFTALTTPFVSTQTTFNDYN